MRYLLHMCKIPVVGCQPSGQLPDPFDWIQLRTIWRQVQQTEPLGTTAAPVCMQDGVMVSGIIGQYNNSTAGVGAYSAKLFHEDPKRISVESAQFPLKDKLPIGKSHGTKVADTFARWVMQNHRVLAFGRNPHSTPGAMLLKMHFVQGPDISRAAEGNLSDFF